MTDELTIQGVNPQMQQVQKKNNTVPYTLGGAAVGAAAGWGATALYKGSGSAKSYEDLVKEANDKDKLELTSKKDAVTKAENELAEASKAVYEGNEKVELENAIKARDAELKRLTEAKEGSRVFQPKRFEDAGIDLRQVVNNERTGQPFATEYGVAKLADVRKEYNILIGDYNTAVARLERNIGAGDAARLNDKKQLIANYFNGVQTRRARTNPKDYDAIFSLEEPGFSHYWTKRKEEYNQAKMTAEALYPEIKDARSLTDEQVKNFATRLEDGASRPNGHSYTHTITEVVDGRKKDVEYTFSKEMFEEFKKAENEKISGLQKEMRGALLTRAGENLTLSKKLDPATFNADFVSSIPDSRASIAGFTDASGHLNLSSLTAEAGTIGTSGIPNPSFYDSDIAKLTKEIEKNGASHRTLPSGLRGSYSSATTVKEALDMATERKSILKDYNADKRELNKALRATLDDYQVLRDLEEKIEATRNADENVKKAKEALLKQFPELSEGTSAKVLTQEEAMKKDSYKRLAQIVENKQAAYDKIAAEKGKVNETAKKTAQEAVEKAKGELDKLVADLNGKVKGMSGTAKALVIGGVAAAGALIGLSMSNKSKNV